MSWQQKRHAAHTLHTSVPINLDWDDIRSEAKWSPSEHRTEQRMNRKLQWQTWFVRRCTTCWIKRHKGNTHQEKLGKVESTYISHKNPIICTSNLVIIEAKQLRILSKENIFLQLRYWEFLIDKLLCKN